MASPLRHTLQGLCLLLGLGACSPPPDAGLKVQAIGVMDRFAPFAEVTGSKEVRIFAARNEYEGFQFVITGGKGGMQNVNVSLSPLSHQDGSSIQQVKVFRERYVNVTTSTPESPYAPQAWPDILLPADNPAANRIAPNDRAFPQDLSEGENLPVWVDLFIPADAKAGEYTGTVTVTATGQTAVKLPVHLIVWDFALPERSPLKTNVGTGSYTIADVYKFERNDNLAENNRLIRAYYDFLLDHHLAPNDLWDAVPQPDANGKPDLKHQFAGLGTVEENMRYYMQERHAPSYTLIFGGTFPFDAPLGKDRAKAQDFLHSYAQWCASHAGEGRCYTDPALVDEPNTPGAYQEVREWGSFFKDINLPKAQQIKFMVTEPPQENQPGLGDLRGSVNVWIPKFYDLWQDVEHTHKNISRQRIEAGEELWAYTAMNLPVPFKNYQKLNPRADVLKGSYPPIWQTDFPGINYRIPTWLFHQYGVTGLHYYNALSWFKGADVWNDAASFVDKESGGVWNGDGLLIYPGYKDKLGFNGPVASLRLKWIRESVEDYMYIDLLEQAGEHAFVQQQLARFARNFGDWDNDPATMMAVREEFGKRLQALHTSTNALPSKIKTRTKK
jgi:hypothetical protein